MLQLNVYSSIVPSPRQAKIGSGFRSIIPHKRHQILRGRIAMKALKDELDGGKGGAQGQSWDPGLEFEVPFEQRPVNEYSSLKEATLYSWANLDPGSFFLRLGGLWLGTLTVLGVPYEESGWYDGQMWVKPPEILARDRLLGSYKVKPVIKLLKQTLVGIGALLIAAVSLFIFATPVENFIQKTFVQNENSSKVSASKISTKFNIRKEELLKLPVEVMSDNDLAAAAAEAADGRPVYCRDRYYRALAGGQYCKWEDLLK